MTTLTLPPQIITRAQSGLRVPTKPMTKDKLPWDDLWAHHSAGSIYATPWDLQYLHQVKNGWRDVAYNFGINYQGKIFELAGLVRHLNSGAGNSGTILFIGNFEVMQVPKEMIKAAAWLVAYGLLAGWWDGEAGGLPHFTGGHRDVPGAKPTACPGKYLMAALPEINRQAAAIIYSLGDKGDDNVIVPGDRGAAGTPKGDAIRDLAAKCRFWFGEHIPDDGIFHEGPMAWAAEELKNWIRVGADRPEHIGPGPAWGSRTWLRCGQFEVELKTLSKP